MPLKVQRGRLMVMSEPWRTFWDGREIPLFGRMESRYLSLLLRFGEVGLGAFEMLLGEDTSARAVPVHMSRLRKALIGKPVKIENIHGWGYRLKMEDNP
ncbi:hypothetical protein SLG_22260 [Sphingobium sp. SYK-6]|nr:hypothetical protein SLG_22260 [Sphingobium sp. SYK-6]